MSLGVNPIPPLGNLLLDRIMGFKGDNVWVRLEGGITTGEGGRRSEKNMEWGHGTGWKSGGNFKIVEPEGLLWVVGGGRPTAMCAGVDFEHL